MEHVAGADLHKRVTRLALLRDGRPPLQAWFPNDRTSVEGALSRLPAGTTIAVESTSSWWWFVDTARRLGHDVVLSRPKLTKAIAAARLKSDKVDGLMLARLLKADLLPLMWIPRERDRHIRELLAHRGRACPCADGRERVAHRARQGAQGLAQEDREATRLMTHPGVEALTVVAVRAWVGDIQRFAARAGTDQRSSRDASLRQSAATERHGHISKEGNRMVRTLVLQAALSAVRHTSGPVRRHYLGVLKRQGKTIARIAAANKLLGVHFQMMKQGVTYEELHQCGGSPQRARPPSWSGSAGPMK